MKHPGEARKQKGQVSVDAFSHEVCSFGKCLGSWSGGEAASA